MNHGYRYELCTLDTSKDEIECSLRYLEFFEPMIFVFQIFFEIVTHSTNIEVMKPCMDGSTCFSPHTLSHN